MMRTIHLLLVLSLLASYAGASAPRTSQPAPDAQSQPATQPALSPELERLLDRVEQAGERFTSLAGDVTYTELDVMFADKTVYEGQVYYHRQAVNEPAQFRIHFDTDRQGPVVTRKDRDYVFTTDEQGQWFITRNQKTMQMVEYQIAPPGENPDPLRLGRGPFPVPFGQRKADVLRLFEVETRGPHRKDPPGTTYLKLTPRPAAAEDLRVREVEMWVNGDGLPLKISTEDVDGQVVKTAEFSNVRTNETLAEGAFRLPRPAPNSGWEHRIELLPADTPADPLDKTAEDNE